MLCEDPYLKAGSAYPCGRCQSCLDKRKKTWANRIMMEASAHAENSFATLTYETDPVSLVPVHLRDFIKRLRWAVAAKSPGKRLRYFAVGEYGDVSQRPHYHLALFGYPECQMGLLRKQPCPCESCSLIRETWGFGLIDLGSLNIKSAQYIAGYVTKKMTRFDDPRLGNRHPEFSRMSLKPGIGFEALHDMADAIIKYDVELTQGDVPSSLRRGASLYPLGRYLRGKLRELSGMEKAAPPSTLNAIKEEVQTVLAAAGIDPQKLPAVVRQQVVKNALIDHGAQARLNIKTRREIHSKGKKV